MKNKKITLYTLLGLATLGTLPCYKAHASQTWQAFCANINVDKSNIAANTLNATNYIVQASDNPAVKLIAQQLNVIKSNNTLSSDQLKRITNITSTGLLNIVLNHQMKECSKSYYTDSLTPLLTSLKNGNKVSFTWNNIRIQNSKVSYKAKTINAQLSGQGNKIQITIHFSGLATSSQHNVPSALIPQQGNINITTSDQVYPLILASTSGNTNPTYANATFPVKINSLDLRNAQTAITANGDITLNNRPTLTSAKGTLRITNMQTLINASSSANNSKLKTGLILAKFAGRNIGDNTLEWDINWQGNLFKVNSVPIPVW